MPQPERDHGQYSCCPRAIRTNKNEIRMRLRKKGTNSERRVIRWETELVTKALKAGLAVTIDNTHLGRTGANFFTRMVIIQSWCAAYSRMARLSTPATKTCRREPRSA